MTSGTDEPGFGPVPDAGGAPPSEPDAPNWPRRIAIALGALVAVLAIVVVVLLLSGDDDDSSKASSTSTTSSTTTSTTTSTTRPTTPSSNSGTSPTTPPTAPPPTTPAPVITTFTSSATVIACPASDVSTTIPTPTINLTWATQNATGVDLSIDGPGIYGSYGPQGSMLFNVACNGATHTYKLTAKGANGQTATRTISVQTRT